MSIKDELFKTAGMLHEKTEGLRKKSSELFNNAQIKLSEQKIEFQIYKKKNELGDIVYQQYLNNVVDDEQIRLLCEEIFQMEKQLKQHQANETTSEKTNDNTDNVFEYKFCEKCGSTIK